MGIKVAVKTKIIVNGKEYHGVEELPAALRAAYEKAIASGAAAGQPARFIELNGRRYDTPEAMPPEVRRLYEDALAGTHADAGSAPATPQEPDGGAIEPAATSRWTFVALLAIGLLVALWFLLSRRG